MMVMRSAWLAGWLVVDEVFVRPNGYWIRAAEQQEWDRGGNDNTTHTPAHMQMGDDINE